MVRRPAALTVTKTDSHQGFREAHHVKPRQAPSRLRLTDSHQDQDPHGNTPTQSPSASHPCTPVRVNQPPSFHGNRCRQTSAQPSPNPVAQPRETRSACQTAQAMAVEASVKTHVKQDVIISASKAKSVRVPTVEHGSIP